MSGVLNFVISIIVTIIFLTLLNIWANKNTINKKVVLLLIILVVAFSCIKFYKMINSSIVSWEKYIVDRQNNTFFEEYDNRIKEEDLRHKEINNNFNDNINYSLPYIPEGFNYVEGEWNNGFVISDHNGNEFVWIPCANHVDNIPEFKKINFGNSPDVLISCNQTYDDEYNEFFDSLVKNGGFYISRYELGKEEDKVASKKDLEIIKNINYQDAYDTCHKIQYDGLKHEIINGYAYDIALKWIMNTNNIEYYKISDNFKSGRNKYNNIFDMTDNVFEWSNENYYDCKIIRGFAINEDYETLNRYSIITDSNIFNENNYLSIRTVLYK